MNTPIKLLKVSLFILVAALWSACSPQASQNNTGLQVVATTTLVGDVVRVIGGDHIELEVMLPTGASPHAYQPTPQDIALVADADLVFANGLELESFLDDLLENAGGAAQLITVSDGIAVLAFDEQVDEHEAEHEAGEEHPEDEHDAEEAEHAEDENDHEHEGGDPHVWFDPNNVLVWVENIEAALSQLDPQNAGAYQANAEAYTSELQALDAWILEQVASIPAERRLLVSDHLSFAYFAERYGFQQVGTVLPGISDQAEPSGAELAALQEQILVLEVPAIFVGATANASLAQRLTEDTGRQLVSLYTGSLTGPDGPASTYLDFMRYNVSAIVAALQ